ADPVPDVVHAGLQRHEAYRLQAPPDFRNRLDPEAPELNLLTRRNVQRAGSELVADAGKHFELPRIRQAIRHANPHHELAGRLTTEKDTCPLQTLPVAFFNALPSPLRQPRYVRHDVESCFFFLVAFDLVQRHDHIT